MFKPATRVSGFNLRQTGDTPEEIIHSITKAESCTSSKLEYKIKGTQTLNSYLILFPLQFYAPFL
jgi:hypothetical protein